MKAITLRPERDEMVSIRTEMVAKGYAVIFYPALWGGNAHGSNRAWCVYGEPDETDYGSLRYLENSLKKSGRKYVIIRSKRKSKD